MESWGTPALKLLHQRENLAHFEPMFHLQADQIVGFYKQNFWKTPVEEWHFK